jgi:hypothetical protein
MNLRALALLAWPRRAVCLVCPLLTACARPPPPPPLVVHLSVQSDPGRPLEGAQVYLNGKAIAASGPTGIAALTLSGSEGTRLEFTVQCPEGYKSPTSPLAVVVRRLGGVTPEYKASCLPLTRTAVVAVAADKGPNLPVVYLGREVARTDASGAADVLLQVTPGEQFTVMLSTQDKLALGLRPQNPTRTFTAKDQDDVFLFAEQFTPPKAAVVHVQGPTGPTRLNVHTLR